MVKFTVAMINSVRVSVKPGTGWAWEICYLPFLIAAFKMSLLRPPCMLSMHSCWASIHPEMELHISLAHPVPSGPGESWHCLVPALKVSIDSPRPTLYRGFCRYSHCTWWTRTLTTILPELQLHFPLAHTLCRKDHGDWQHFSPALKWSCKCHWSTLYVYSRQQMRRGDDNNNNDFNLVKGT